MYRRKIFKTTKKTVKHDLKINTVERIFFIKVQSFFEHEIILQQMRYLNIVI